MIQPEVVLKGAGKVLAGLKRARANADKAMDTAVRVRGFKMMKLLRRELAGGAPGGRRFAPLSFMRRAERSMFSKTGRLGADKPLRALSRAVGYEVPRNSPLEVKIGFVGRASSVTWRRLARRLQEGFVTSTNEPYMRGMNVEEYLRETGSWVDRRMFGGRKSRRRNVFFLKKSTLFLHTPARLIIEPFLKANRTEAMAKIRRDFRLKMMGRRI